MKAIGQVTVEKRTERFYFFVNFLEIVIFFGLSILHLVGPQNIWNFLQKRKLDFQKVWILPSVNGENFSQCGKYRHGCELIFKQKLV